MGEKNGRAGSGLTGTEAPHGLRHADPSTRGVVVFDFDGTIADTLPSIVAVARHVLSAWGLPQERLADCPKLVGPPFPQAFSMVFGLSEADAREVTRRYREEYGALGPEAWPAFPGMGALLEGLRASGRLLAVASSKRTEILHRALSDEGLLGRFDVVRGKQSDAQQSKAETLSAVLEDLGVAADDAVMVGDRHFDVDAALACGVPCVGVTYGGTAPLGELEEAGACTVAGSVEELGHVLLGR
ncbi:HAD family hydrolase [Parafannyhessea umbonata]|uniref:Phosphoglycolate phosphatase n=1 Tax=Parafannyhessea umbonata TaxID=604330 RepID=A0A1H1KXQ7_9ACTN|nr:HAD hydrolase-like protein [Parafannyhessea umbonata]SDR67138.1 phosphoglycolate phosphatase [Parafannyhessea umbonata]